MPAMKAMKVKAKAAQSAMKVKAKAKAKGKAEETDAALRSGSATGYRKLKAKVEQLELEVDKVKHVNTSLTEERDYLKKLTEAQSAQITTLQIQLERRVRDSSTSFLPPSSWGGAGAPGTPELADSRR
jgi:hypothetical protein